MTRSRKSRSSRFSSLALLASVTSVASAQAIALTRLDLITNVFITPQCLDAYTTPLLDCELRDFLPGFECSRRCIRNLRELEPIIQEACSTAKPKPSTLLDRIQNGDLVAAVCGAPDNNNGNNGNRQSTDTRQWTTITMTTRLDSDLPMMTTTITKAITPRPPRPTLTTTRIRPLPPSVTEDSSTIESTTGEVTRTRTRPSNPPLSSETSSSEEPETTTERATTRAPPRSSETTSQESPSSTAPANTADDQNNDGDDQDTGRDDGNGNAGRLPGSGGGSLADIGFEGSSTMPNPRHLTLTAAVLGAMLSVL
ncbi:hypothetical protein LIA77_00359 [Sarocladium implicatum]|nr:hypothetical protein LIA77_00359 [Sarocladium implicatum]